MRYSPTERIGVSHVEKIFTQDFGWIFRDQLVSDMGIDSHVEVVENSHATGILLALQIKTGESYFQRQGTNFVYYVDDDHYDYWMGHSLPVFLVMHNPTDGVTLWQAINQRTVERLDKSWKLVVPQENILGAAAKQHLIDQVPSTEYQRRLVQLRIHLPLLNAIADGRKVVMETNEWLHKSLNRGQIKMFVDDKAEARQVVTWPFYSSLGIKDMIAHYFPWFTVSVDDEFYEQNFEEGSVRNIFRTLPTPYPWRIQSGEYAEYRLRLNLSELGLGYVNVERFLSRKSGN